MVYLLTLFAVLAMLSPLFLIAIRKYTGRRAQHALLVNLCSFAGCMVLAVVFGFFGSAQAAEAAGTAAAAAPESISTGLKYVAAALAVGLSGIGGGIAVASSASAALGVGLNMFADKFLAMGISPDIIHRISVMASGGLDTLPHSSGTASALGVAQLSHKEGYLHVFWLNTAIPIAVTAVACVLASLGVC